MKPRPSSSVASFRLTATDRVTSCARAAAAARNTATKAIARIRLSRIGTPPEPALDRATVVPVMTNRPSRPTPHATQPPATLQSAHENIIAARVKTKVWLELGGEFFVGDGGIHLLGGILQHGSLAQTVREIGWSYRHAWGYLRRAERALPRRTRRGPGHGAHRDRPPAARAAARIAGSDRRRPRPDRANPGRGGRPRAGRSARIPRPPGARRTKGQA